MLRHELTLRNFLFEKVQTSNCQNKHLDLQNQIYNSSVSSHSATVSLCLQMPPKKSVTASKVVKATKNTAKATVQKTVTTKVVTKTTTKLVKKAAAENKVTVKVNKALTAK